MIASGHKGWFIFCLVVAVGAVGLAIVAAVPDVKGWLGGGLLASRIGDQPEAEESIAVRQQAVGISVPRVVANFMGRDELLAQLDAALSADRADVIIQVISGLDGVGKSQLAAAYVQAHRDDFDHVAWVRAGEDGGIADLGALAEELTLPVAGLIPAERANAVLMFLGKTDRRWLLVVDNAPGPQALEWLPTSGRGRVLVTSRHRGSWDTFGAELAIDVFRASTARRYLLASSKRTDQEAADADKVAVALGCLPLALAHAGAYCASDAGVPFGEYRELLEELPSQELFRTNREVFYQQTVAATWNISIIAAEQRAQLARQALEMMAYLAPEAVPRSFVLVLDDSSAVGRKKVADALAALHSYSLATVAGDWISVHRLLQKVIRDQIATDNQASPAAHLISMRQLLQVIRNRFASRRQTSAATQALIAIQRALPGDPQLPKTWPRWQELLPHVVALASAEAVVGQPRRCPARADSQSGV